MNPIQELNNQTNVRLTAIQKAVLIVIYTARTPYLAHESIVGNEYVVYAKQFLENNGLIVVNDGGIKITGNGYETLIQNGLIDENGKPTEEGQTLSNNYAEQKQKIEEHKVDFYYIRNLLK